MLRQNWRERQSQEQKQTTNKIEKPHRRQNDVTQKEEEITHEKIFGTIRC